MRVCSPVVRAPAADGQAGERGRDGARSDVAFGVSEALVGPGGGAIEIELAQKLAQYARTLQGAEQCCVKAFAEALQVIPFTLAENAGLDPIEIVTDLRNKHAQGHKRAGINVKQGKVVEDIMQEKHNIKQPTLVTESALQLATETVRMILKIDDLVISAR